MDREKIAFHIKGLLEAIGEDPEREGLKETPERVARMYCEIFRGIAYSNAEVAEKYAKCFSEDDLCAVLPVFWGYEDSAAILAVRTDNVASAETLRNYFRREKIKE